MAGFLVVVVTLCVVVVGLLEVEVVLRVVDLGNEISIVLQLRSMPFSIFS